LTRCGPLDLLGVVPGKLYDLYNYEDLLPHSEEIDIGGGCPVRVLNLEMLISLKESLPTEKNLAVLPIFRRVLEERKRLGFTPQQ
jgi:predicted nucleotidyltransferase